MSRLTLPLIAAVFAGFGASAVAADAYTPGEPVRAKFKDFAQGFLDQHCIECHDDETSKGDLNLLELSRVDETNAAIWKSVWAQVALEEMPPKKKDQPEVIDRLRFSDWIVGELQRAMKNKGGFHAHQDPKKGNFVAHDLLFGPLPEGIELTPTASPARIWRVTPQEHITRLNELINTEPKYDPEKPGLRAHGDVVPTNHGGELKLYFGTDRITRWVGGTVAYATAVKSVPVVLSAARKTGLKNYPDFYSVNSAEATQILGKAEDILQYMADGPLSLVGMPEQITDDPKTYDAVKPPGDLRGLPTAITYSTKIVRPLTPVLDLMKEPEVTDERLRAAVDYLFEALTFRPPNRPESDSYLQIVKDSIAKVGREDGAVMGLSSIFLDRDALFRPELAETGKPDPHGRVMLQDWELGLAVNHALQYLKPDEPLRQAIIDGRMRTRGDVKREVTRMLDDDSIRKPRVLQFFRDYFDYDLAGYICKDTKALAATGVSDRGASHYRAMFDGVASTDRLIELILAEDKDVLKELLTTQRVVATKADNTYFGRKHTQEEREAAVAAKKKAEAEEARKEVAELEALKAEVAELESKLKANPGDKATQKSVDSKRRSLVAAEKRVAAAKKSRQRGGGANVDVAEADDIAIRRHGQPRHPSRHLDSGALARRRHPRCADHRRRPASGRAGAHASRTHASHEGDLLLDLPPKDGPTWPALRDVQPRRSVPNDRTRQTRRCHWRDHRQRRSHPRRPRRQRPRNDHQARQQRARRASLRPPRLPLLDGPQ